jgi:hypothetical protein
MMLHTCAVVRRSATADPARYLELADWTRRSHHDAARADRNHAGDRARRHLHLQVIHRGNQVHANAILAMHPNVIGSQRSATRQAGFLVHLGIFVGCHQAERAA